MSKTLRILVIDDDPDLRDACSQTLIKTGHEVVLASTGTRGLTYLVNQAFDVVLLDLRMPDLDGMSLLAQVREQDQETVIIVISGYGSVETAVQAMKLGAFDFLPKPFTPKELRQAVDKAHAHRDMLLKNASYREELRQQRAKFKLETKSPVMLSILEMLKKVARTDTTVLFTGESGTGKGLLARYLHDISPRKDHAFVSVDCSTLVPTLFESELFGHIKGSFTGADSAKTGKFELSNGGTLFLDEVSNISLEIQAKLLHAVEERAISKVGSNRVIRVDTRLVAATNQDLAEQVAKGAFREDLFYRMNVMPIHLPPLRERPEDIALLARHFLARFHTLSAVDLEGFTKNALKTLEAYHWPGNIRELLNTIQRLAILAGGRLITQQDVKASLPRFNTGTNNRPLKLAEVEKQHIREILRRMDGHRSDTARALGIDRKTLRLKIRKYGLEEIA